MVIKSLSATAMRSLVKDLAARAAELRREARAMALPEPAQYMRMMAHAYAQSAREIAHRANQF